MNQTELNEKLARYLELKNNWELAAAIRDGTCFAYSLCYSSMALSKRLGWWEAAINKIAQWDGKMPSLNEATYLKQARNPYETLGFLFQRIIHYVIFHQPMRAMNGIFKDLQQRDVLKPKMHYFELNEAGNTIKQCKNMIGYFTEEDLDLLLTPALLQHNLALIGCRDHSCVIRYARNQWHLFDANHSCANAIMYKDKSEFIQHIFKSLGDQTLDICIASLNEEASLDFTPYHQLLENKLEQLLKNETFDFFASEAPEYLPLIIEQARHNKQVRNEILPCLGRGLHYVIKNSPESWIPLIESFCQNEFDFNRFIKRLPEAISNINTSFAMQLIQLLIALKNSAYDNQLTALLNLQKALHTSLEYDVLKTIVEGKITRVINDKTFLPFKHITAYTNGGAVEVMEVEEEGMDVDRGWFITWF